MSARSLLVLLFICTAVVAAPVPKSLKKRPDPFATARFKVNYSKAGIDKVLEHFAEETGLEWVGDRPDLRTVTLNPRKEYNGAEYLDLLNELLEVDNFILIRHARTFYLHAAGEPIDVDRLDTISVEELVVPRAPVQRPAVNGGGGGGQWINGQWVPAQPVAPPPPQAQAQADVGKLPPPSPPKRGKTEVATAVIPLTTVSYADIRPQAAKSLSPFGRLEAGEDGRSMRVTDRVDNLRLLHAVVNDSVKSNCGVK